jgi:hypothetical protein
MAFIIVITAVSMPDDPSMGGAFIPAIDEKNQG